MCDLDGGVGGGGHVASHDTESYAGGSIATVKSCPCQTMKQFTKLVMRGVLTQEQPTLEHQ